MTTDTDKKKGSLRARGNSSCPAGTEARGDQPSSSSGSSMDGNTRLRSNNKFTTTRRFKGAAAAPQHQINAVNVWPFLLPVGAVFVLLYLWHDVVHPTTTTTATAAKRSLQQQQLAQQASAALKATNSRPQYLRGGGFQAAHEGTYGDDLRAILEGRLHLVGIVMKHRPTHRRERTEEETSTTYQGGVVGEFCRLDWQLHKKDPSATPMFHDLLSKSTDCQTNRVQLDLKTVVKAATEYDNEQQRKKMTNTAAAAAVASPKLLNLTAVAFHESRCGSTLLANMLVAMEPTQHRVYSESGPPITAMMSCGETFDLCPPSHAASLLKDVVYLMSRSDDPQEERVFFKIQSLGSLYIDVFRMAFPTTPWIYVYREPVQVMMSHLAKGTSHALCVRNQQSPNPAVLQIAKAVEQHTTRGKNPADWPAEDFCAAHLASLMSSAAASAGLDGSGTSHGRPNQDAMIPLNYADMPDRLYEDILPHKLGLLLNKPQLDRLAQVSTQYSKNWKGTTMTAKTTDGVFQSDSQKKEDRASDAVRAAAKAFMDRPYQVLQAAAARQQLQGSMGA